MVLSTQQVRDEYGADCTEREVAGAQEAWDGLSAWMEHYRYELRQADTGSRACRAITGGTKKSLHAIFLAVRILLWNLRKRIAGGAACDFNWQTNPYGQRLVTDMPRAMVDAICGIRTRSGAVVFRWGGYYSGNKDGMHYELVCARADLATGIDPATLPGAATKEDDMFEDPDRTELRNVRQTGINTESRVIGLEQRTANIDTALDKVVMPALGRMEKAIATLSVGGVDEDALAAKVADILAKRLKD